jgi:hypothetical protein
MVIEDIVSIVNNVRNQQPCYADDEAFIHWFLEAYLLFGESDAVIKKCIVGGSGDKNIDAYYCDPRSQKVFIIQSKYRQSASAIEKQNDVIQFFWTCKKIQEAYAEFVATVKNAEVKIALKAIKNAVDRGFAIVPVYVTTGKISDGIKKDVRDTFKGIQPIISDFPVVEGLYHDYLDGVAPPVPFIRLSAAQGEFIKLESPDDKKVKTFHFFTFSKDVRKAFKENDIKLFARNIRGYLGETKINSGIMGTLKDEPEYFHYYNNGITIISDEGECYASDSEFVLTNPQIINGQQTTRSIADSKSDDALVSVRVISIPKSNSKFQNIVKSIVSRTNYQNAIKASDIASNDKVQVWLEKELRKLGYRYIRKRMIRYEENKFYSQIYDWRIDRQVLAQSVAAIVIGPKEVREGIEKLYEDERVYKRVFKENAPTEYFLIPFWVHTAVKESSTQARSYALWFAVNYFHRALNSSIEPNDWKKYIKICERKKLQKEREIYLCFVKLGDLVFRMLIEGLFARKEKEEKKAGREIERSTFFKTEKAVAELEIYLKSPVSSQYRKPIDTQVAKIHKILKAYELG